jgi:hypothetical protein
MQRQGHRTQPAHHFESADELKEVIMENVYYHLTNYVKDKGEEAKDFVKDLKNLIPDMKQKAQNKKSKKSKGSVAG